MSTQPQYILHARSYGIAVAAGLNGSTTLRDESGEGQSFYRPINEWVLPERNVLTGLIFQPPGGALPGGAPAGGADAFVHLELLLADANGELVPDAPPLGSFRWPAPGRPTILPSPILQPVVAAGAVATRLWTQAEALDTLEEADKEAIVALVNALVQALAVQDAPGVVQLLDYRLDDEARARAQDPVAVKAGVAQMVGGFARFRERPATLSVAQALFTPAAGGRAWHVQRGWMQPAVAFEDEDLAFSIEVYASRVEGRWLISRA